MEELKSKKSFDAVIDNDSFTTVIEFSSSVCQPCKQQKFILEQSKLGKEVLLYIVDVNRKECLSIVKKYNIMAVPTLLIFKDKELKLDLLGCKSELELRYLIDNIK